MMEIFLGERRFVTTYLATAVPAAELAE